MNHDSSVRTPDRCLHRVSRDGWRLSRAMLVAWLLVPLARGQEEPAAFEPATGSPGATTGTAERLRTVFSHVEAFSGIEVEVRDGVVTLAGTTPTLTAKEGAVTIARELPGVLWVDDTGLASERLDGTRDGGIAEALRSIFSQSAEFEEVDVQVTAGVVRLDGRVLSSARAESAVDIARSIEGVIHVNDALEVEMGVLRRVLPSLDRLTAQVRSLLVRTPLLLVAGLVFGLFVLLSRWAQRLSGLWERLFGSRIAGDIAGQVARALVLFLGAFVVLELLDATRIAAAALGTAGLVGLAVSFAFRDIIENWPASILLGMRKPFRAMDVVQVGDYTGKVVRLTTSETLLMTFDGNHVRLPNSMVFKNALVNYTRNPLRRFDFAVGVGVMEDLERVRALGLSTLRDLAGVASDPEAFALIEALGDSAVNMRFYGWVDQREADFAKVQSAAIQTVKVVFDRNGVDMPVPSYSIHLDRSTGPREQQQMTSGETKPLTAKSASEVPGEASVDTSVDTSIDRQIAQQSAEEAGEEDFLAEERQDRGRARAERML